MFLSLVGDIRRLELVKLTMGLGMSEEGMASDFAAVEPEGAVSMETIGRDTDMYVTRGDGVTTGERGVGIGKFAREGDGRNWGVFSPGLLMGEGRGGGVARGDEGRPCRTTCDGKPRTGDSEEPCGSAKLDMRGSSL